MCDVNSGGGCFQAANLPSISIPISYKFATNDEFKIAAEGWNPEFGYSNELDSTYFSASGTNIKVKFAGTYLIEVTYSTDGSKDEVHIKNY